jgi:pimeloyl-ACP methyl ester carboxylesterase
MPFARINGLELYYEVTDFTRPWEGEPETIVLLHGLHGHLGWWNWFQVAPLAQHLRVVTLDQRGHGRSFKPAAGYTIAAMAEDVSQLIERLDLGAVHLCGASMGGMVSLQCALAHPEQVRSLTLVDSYPHCPRSIREAIQVWIDDTQRRGYPAVMATFNDDYAAVLFSPAFRRAHPEFPAYETRLVLDNLMPDAAFVGACRAIQEFDIAARLGEIAVPVLIMTSNEGMAYEESLRMEQALPNAQLWAPPDVGHSPHIEIPDEFARRLLAFLREVSAR